MCLHPPGLADENESVREAALSAGHVLVEHYATTYEVFNTISFSLMMDNSGWPCSFIIDSEFIHFTNSHST